MSDKRLCVAKKVWDGLFVKIDENGFLDLNKDKCDRAELYLYALSLGVAGKTKGNRPTSRAIVRSETLKQAWAHLLYIVYLDSNKKRGFVHKCGCVGG